LPSNEFIHSENSPKIYVGWALPQTH